MGYGKRKEGKVETGNANLKMTKKTHNSCRSAFFFVPLCPNCLVACQNGRVVVFWQGICKETNRKKHTQHNETSINKKISGNDY